MSKLLELIKTWLSALFQTKTTDNTTPVETVKETATAEDPIEEGKEALEELIGVGVATPEPVATGETIVTDTYKLTKAGIINNIIAVEAGYVNNVDDKGGETNYGITYAVANTKAMKKALVDNFNWDGTMKNLTKEMAYYVYETNYWNKMNLDTVFLISPSLADKLFDQGVNVGISRSVKWLQRALNAFNRKQADYADIAVDGGLGNGTITAINTFVQKRGRENAVRNLLMALVCAQGYHYLTISETTESNESFTYGWYDHRLPNNLNKYPELASYYK